MGVRIAQSTASLGVATLPIAGDAAQPSGSAYQFPPGSYTFRAPKAGYWKFVLWGGSVLNGISATASGSYAEYTTFLDPSMAVSLVVGTFEDGSGSSGTSSATFPNGKVVTAACPAFATPSVGGVASGGDVNLNGSAPGVAGLGTGGGAANSGGGAPAMLPFRGGDGGVNTTSRPAATGKTPGGGAGGSNPTTPGMGQIIVLFVRP